MNKNSEVILEILFFWNCFYCTDVSMQHEFQPSKLAAMCVAAARYHRNLEPVWPHRLVKLTDYKWECIKFDFIKLFSITLIPRDRLKAELDESINEESDLEFD